jgi:hypothetical protein
LNYKKEVKSKMQSSTFQSSVRKAGQLELSGRNLKVNSSKISRVHIDGRKSIYDDMLVDNSQTRRQQRNQEDYEKVKQRKSSYMSSSNSSPYPNEPQIGVSPRYSIDSQTESPRSLPKTQRINQHRDSEMSVINLSNKNRIPSNTINNKSRSPMRHSLRDASNSYENSPPSSQRKDRDRTASSQNKELVSESNLRSKTRKGDERADKNNKQEDVESTKTAFVISEMKLNKRDSVDTLKKSDAPNQEKEIEVHPGNEKEPIETTDRKEKYNSSDYMGLAKKNIIDYIQTPAPAEFMIRCKILVETGVFNNYLFYLENYRGRGDDLLLMSTRRKKASTSLYFRIEAFESANIGSGGHFIDFGKVTSNFGRSSYTLIGNLDNEDDENMSQSSSNLQSSNRTESRMSDKKNANSRKYFDLEYNNKIIGQTKPKDIRLEMLVNDSLNEIANTNASVIENTFQRGKNKRVTLITKKPEFDPATKKYRLDFSGRARMASSNNMQIIDGSNPSKVLFQLGKKKSKFYYCDYTYPFTAFQAFGLAISSLSRG